MALNRGFVRIMLRNQLHNASLSTIATHAPKLGIENIISEDKSFVLKTDSAQDFEWVANFEKPAPLNELIIDAHNFCPTTEIRTTVWSGENKAGTELYKSEWIKPVATQAMNQIPFFSINPFYLQAVSQSKRWTHAFDDTAGRSLQVEIKDGQNPAGFTQFGYAMAGSTFEPKNNFNWKIKRGIRSSSQQIRTKAGLFAVKGVTWNAYGFVLEFLTDEEMRRFTEELEYVELVENIYISFYPEDTSKKEQYEFIGKITQLDDSSHDFLNYNSIAIKVENS